MKNNMLLTFAALGLAIVGVGVFFVSHNDSAPEAQILSVNPNMVTVQSIKDDCQQQDYTTTVKNPNRNFINGLFDSSAHPEYIKKNKQKVVCNKVVVESQVQMGYLVEYQIKKHTASMVLTSAPQVGSSLSLVELDGLAESHVNTVLVGEVKTNTTANINTSAAN